jgi:hypothetical protein
MQLRKSYRSADEPDGRNHAWLFLKIMLHTFYIKIEEEESTSRATAQIIHGWKDEGATWSWRGPPSLGKGRWGIGPIT